MIKYLYANNYKSFVNFRIDFGKSNLLIGKNGAGKSNIFTLIASIRDIIIGNGNAVSSAFSLSTLTRWMKSNIQTFEIGLTNGGKDFVYRIEIEHDMETAKCKIASEKLTCDGIVLYQMLNGTAEVYDDDSNQSRVLVDSSSSGIAFVPDYRHSVLAEFKKQISSIILCTPDPRSMSDIVQNDVFIPQVNFSNIASTYAGVVLLEPDIFNELISTFREASKGFVKARIQVDVFTNLKRLMLNYKYKDVESSYYFSELSDGEKMLFALYMLLFGYMKRGMTVLLDEPDNFVSLREIQPWCMNVEKNLGEGCQSIIISHHPEIIDYMAETDGIWMTRLDSGESRIVSKPDIGINTDLLTYSQMISRGLLDEME